MISDSLRHGAASEGTERETSKNMDDDYQWARWKGPAVPPVNS